MVQAMERGMLAKRVSDYLKRELRNRRITQEAFAEMISTSPRTVRRWLSDGIHNLETIEECIQVLGITAGDIFADAVVSPTALQDHCCLPMSVPIGHFLSCCALFFYVLIELLKARNKSKHKNGRKKSCITFQ